MVGYREQDTMSTNQKFVAGCVSGCATRLLVQPMDVLKLRMQVTKKLKTGKNVMIREARKIYRREGKWAFFHGHLLGQTHSVVSTGSQFYIYELATKHTGGYFPREKKPLQNFLCGVFSGCCSTTLVLPLEVVRVRQMMSKQEYSNLWVGAKRVYQTGGLLAFYEGLSASLLMVGPATGITFLVFTSVQQHILSYSNWFPKYEKSQRVVGMEHKPQYLMVASIIAASVAGFISKTATYPLDLAKKRLQFSSHQHSPDGGSHSRLSKLRVCHSLFKCMSDAYSDHGIRGLYRGWTVTMWKTQSTMILSFTFYEMICHGIRMINNKQD